jgi:hypothetical protein
MLCSHFCCDAAALYYYIFFIEAIPIGYIGIGAQNWMRFMMQDEYIYIL